MFSIPPIPFLTGERLIVLQQSEFNNLFRQQEALLAAISMVVLFLTIQLGFNVLASAFSLFWSLISWPFRSSPKTPCVKKSESPSEIGTVLQVLEKQHQTTLEMLTLLAQQSCAPRPKRILRSPRKPRVVFRAPMAYCDSPTTSTSTAQESTQQYITAMTDYLTNNLAGADHFKTMLEENIAFCDNLI
ncbi:hypothetical protein IWQ62_004218, partial [Dispira parvispora]